MIRELRTLATTRPCRAARLAAVDAVLTVALKGAGLMVGWAIRYGWREIREAGNGGRW